MFSADFFFQCVQMAKTLNKDGTPRKIGSGKTKGAGCYTDITWAQLKNSIGEETNIPVSRVWINSLGISTDSKPKKNIQTKLLKQITTINLSSLKSYPSQRLFIFKRASRIPIKEK